LRNSNTCRDRAFEKRRFCRWTTAALVLVCLATATHAVNPHRMISQYAWDSWGDERGFPGGSVAAIAQTNDGYLWIGTEKGLVRFDGLSFRVFAQAIPEPFRIGPIQALVTDAEGNLWILVQGTQILRLQDGNFELGREQAEFGITAIGRRRNGTILLSSLAYGTLTYNGQKFEILQSPTGKQPTSATTASGRTNDELSSRLSWSTTVAAHRFAEPNTSVISMAETTDGKLWLATRDRGLFYISDGGVSAARKGETGSKITCLLALANGELWIGTEEGVIDWNGTKFTQRGIPPSLRHIKVFTMIRDRDSNIWLGTTRGLVRVNAEGVSFAGGTPGTSKPVTALFEDREGNLWVGGAGGLGRLRDSAFNTYSVLSQPVGNSGAIYIDKQERAWFAPFEGGLYWLRGGKTGRVTNDGLNQDVVYSIAGSTDGLWVGRRRGGLTHLRYSDDTFTAHTYTQTDGLPQNSVYAVYQSRDGTVWSGTLSGGVAELTNGHFTTYTATNGLASNTVSSIAEGADGTMWFGTPNGLSEMSKSGWRKYTTREGLSSQDVNCLLPDSTGVLWIGTADGLAFLRAGNIQVPRRVPDRLHEPIFGIAEDRNGWLWIATADHVLQVKRDSLMADALSEADVREYGTEDGLQGTEGVKRFRSVVIDSRWQVWFSTNRGLSVVDPGRVQQLAEYRRAPPVVHIEGVASGGREFDLGGPIRVPPGEHRATFRYVGLSLSNSERVRYRYRLDGFDRGWSEAVTSREATYGNLGAGKYRFRVIASNSDGIWSGTEAAVGFEVQPTLWQTWWFRLSGVAAFLVLLWAAYQLRLRQVTAQVRQRLEGRFEERERIAHELHDTLLQSFQGILISFHAAINVLPNRPDIAKARDRLEGAVDQAQKAITEGRDAVQGLRSSMTETNDLAATLRTLGEGLAANQTNQTSAVFDVGVEGTPRDLHPILRDDVVRIAGEALRNAFIHAHASRIEVEIHYGQSRLRLRIRDDGKGIESGTVTDKGSAGHWGLRGMRERAKLVGGDLEVWSKPDSGTEIELTIPASTAYARPSPERRSWLYWRRAVKTDDSRMT
jgi:ligand-binding sensor domain-containing protein/signal transduction histidine kinase